jgi:Fanconi anemia group M protein
MTSDRLAEPLGDITPREYQVSIARQCLQKNTMVVLPTGLGKTVIAALAIREILDRGGRALFLAPTKPLVSQHGRTLKNMLGMPDRVGLLTGETGQSRREGILSSSVVVSTPQTIENLVDSGKIDLSAYGILVFDEVHRASGNYAYVKIAKAYLASSAGLILGMTASPGGDRSKLNVLMKIMGFQNAVIKSEDDPDVRKYVQETRTEIVRIKRPPEVDEILAIARKILSEISAKLQKSDEFSGVRLTRKEVASAISDLSGRARSGEPELFNLIPVATSYIRFDYAVEYLESQGVEIFQEYLLQIINSEDKSMQRTARILRSFPEFESMMRMTADFMEHGDNPKMMYVKRLCEDRLTSNPGGKILVFTHFRKTSEILTEYLSRNSPGLKVARFVGQGTKGEDRGMNQKTQESVLDDFRNGKYRVLVATSVAEEGLDIPSTDLVIFYEPIPSDIRSIQRRGRTGRNRAGEVVILTYEGSRDIGYLLSSMNKESRMRKNLYSLSRENESSPVSRKKDFDLYDFS